MNLVWKLGIIDKKLEMSSEIRWTFTGLTYHRRWLSRQPENSSDDDDVLMWFWLFGSSKNSHGGIIAILNSLCVILCPLLARISANKLRKRAHIISTNKRK